VFLSWTNKRIIALVDKKEIKAGLVTAWDTVFRNGHPARNHVMKEENIERQRDWLVNIIQ